jgi:serine/threonine protein kinase
MDASQPGQSLRDIFDGAVELPATQRVEFLTASCGDNVKLRAAVESLLAAHDRAGSFLADPVIAVGLLHAREQLSPGSRVDRYTLINVLGEGGYGTVYLAEQDPPLRRRVALKVIKPGMDSRQVIARFELERRSLAVMDHPNIAKVFDAGSTANGYPYFVMELVNGIPITEFCRSFEIELPARLRLFTAVCAAVHHAHERGVVHRDLKPGNVLVALQDGNPTPKVIDFGIAKALQSGTSEGNPITLEPQFLGTPQYMSPEQACLLGNDVDWRSDVYSLGALLYELLSDMPPFDRAQFKSAAIGEIGRLLQEVDPPAPSERLSVKEPASPKLDRRFAEMRKRLPLVRGNLDRIVMKAMEKESEHRYQTAAALGADVERHLQGMPIESRNRLLPDRVARGIRRNRRALMVAAAMIGIVLLGAAGGAWWHARHARTTVAAVPIAGSPAAVAVTAAPMAGAAPPAADVPVVWVNFERGATSLQLLTNGRYAFANRDYKFHRLPDELEGLTFTERAGGQPVDVAIDISPGATVYLLVNSDSNSQGMVRLNERLPTLGWLRLADCDYAPGNPLAVFRQTFGQHRHVTLSGAGFAGFIVASNHVKLGTGPAPSPATRTGEAGRGTSSN